MRRFIMGAVLALLAGAAGGMDLSSDYPCEPDEARALYQFALERSGARPPATGARDLRAADYIGRAVEVRGALAGRIVVNADDPARRTVLIRLELSDGGSLYAASPGELNGLQNGDPVRAILDVAEGCPVEARFRLRAIVREHDMPPDPAPPAPRAQSRTVAPQPATVPSPLAVPTPAPSAAAPGMALPPQFRGGQAALFPTVAPLPPSASTAPRPGKDGVWDPLGTVGIPIIEQGTLDVWKGFIRKHNRSRTDQEADWIARWVIYYSAVFGVDHRLMFAMIKCESNFNPVAVSRSGAMGLTQLMPVNVREFKVSNVWNVQDNVRAGIEHFRQMLDMWEGRSNYEQFALGAASYNAGPNRVKRAGGIPNITETRNYVRKLGDLFYQLVREGYP